MYDFRKRSLKTGRGRILESVYIVDQRGLIGRVRATSGPRPLVTTPAKWFLNLLVVITSLFIFFTPKDPKNRKAALRYLK